MVGEKRCAFFQSSKTITGSFKEKRKIQIFAVFWKEKLYTGIWEISFCYWRELETEFVHTWFVCMSSTTAVVEAAKVYQKEHEHIRVYASKFEELHCFLEVHGQKNQFLDC